MTKTGLSCLNALGLWLDFGKQPGMGTALGKGKNPEAQGVLSLGFSRPQIHDGLWQEKPQEPLGT